MPETGGKFLFGTWLSATEIQLVAICSEVSHHGRAWDADVKDALYKLLKALVSPHMTKARHRGGAGAPRSPDQAYQLLLLELTTHGMDAPDAVMRRILAIWAAAAFGKSRELAGFDSQELLDAVLKELKIST